MTAIRRIPAPAACLAAAAALLAAGSAPPPAEKRDTTPRDTTPRTVEAAPPRISVDLALEERDFERAHALIERRVAAGDRDPTMLYNGACALAQLGRATEAEARLLEAVRAGFRDFAAMEADPDLEPIRAGDTYGAILEAASLASSERAARASAPSASRETRRSSGPDPVEAWRAKHGDRYRYESDPERRLAYATFLPPPSHERMKAVLAELEEHLRAAYFGKPPDKTVLVAIVRPEDAGEYLERPEIRGIYLHRARRLVARDVGQSLTHEFVHLMHFAHMERTGQRHPIWVQEGLASLYEAYEILPGGRAEFQPNVRFNIARRQVVAKSSKPWKDLVGMKPDDFMDDAERLYPQVRAMFEFFARDGKLEAFYEALCATSGDDPDGSTAIERAFGEPLSKVEDRWKRWMVSRGAVDDTVERRDASLGITGEDSGDGVRIRAFVIDSASKAAGLRVGDIIFSVDGVPVRNRDELVLAVARLEVGRPVEVRYRRDGAERSVTLEPRPLGGR